MKSKSRILVLFFAVIICIVLAITWSKTTLPTTADLVIQVRTEIHKHGGVIEVHDSTMGVEGYGFRAYAWASGVAIRYWNMDEVVVPHVVADTTGDGKVDVAYMEGTDGSSMLDLLSCCDFYPPRKVQKEYRDNLLRFIRNK